jgi:hypothetical protein
VKQFDVSKKQLQVIKHWGWFSISAVPTLIAFDKGKIISRDAKIDVGLNKSNLDSMLKEVIRK